MFFAWAFLDTLSIKREYLTKGGNMERMVKGKMAKAIACYMVMAIVVIGLAQKVYAGFSSSEMVGVPSFDRAADLETIRKVLEVKIIREKLKDLGLTPDETQKRLDQLSDSQIHQLALQIEDLQVGGDGLGVVIALLIIAILVVILIYLLGHRIEVK
jgi:hypothetical protein